MAKRRKDARQDNPHPSPRATYHEPPLHDTPAPRSKVLTPATPAQERHLRALKTQTCVVSVGPAGCGKTYLPAAYAAQQLLAGNIERIVLTRPAVESGPGIGFRKGTTLEKFGPYIAPVLAVLREYLGRGYVDYCMKEGVERIFPIPLCDIQGWSFNNSIILLGEAENATPQEMKLLLTRLGEGSKVFIDGDLEQQYTNGQSGLEDGVDKVRHIPGAAVIRYAVEDCVRSGFARRVLEAYAGISYGPEPQGVFAL